MSRDLNDAQGPAMSVSQEKSFEAEGTSNTNNPEEGSMFDILERTRIF